VQVISACEKCILLIEEHSLAILVQGGVVYVKWDGKQHKQQMLFWKSHAFHEVP